VLFDAHLHAESLRASDLKDLIFFEVGGALVLSDDAVSGTTGPEIRAHWDLIAGATVAKLRSAGLLAYAGVGLHPKKIPWSGLELLLNELPEVLSRPSVVAIGEIGLELGTEREEEIFSRQLMMAHELRLPVIVHTPTKSKVRITRQTLTLLKEAEIDPKLVLVDHLDERTIKMVSACGYWMGVSLSSNAAPRLRRDPVADAVRLVTSMGADRLVCNSDAGDGAGDLLGLPRAADRMRKMGLSEAVVSRVCGSNAMKFIGVSQTSPRAVAPAS
jgi:uncharacterized protein